jgi:hypothetical protein
MEKKKKRVSSDPEFRIIDGEKFKLKSNHHKKDYAELSAKIVKRYDKGRKTRILKSKSKSFKYALYVNVKKYK